MKIESGISISGKYDLMLRNTKTGEVKEYHTHNVITTSGIANLLTTARRGSMWGGDGASVSGVRCGTGTGSPSPSDTGLFHEVWSALYPNDNSVQLVDVSSRFSDDSRQVREVTFAIVVPAKAAYTGELTELGLGIGWHDSNYYRDLGLFTHALFLDAEGNPITITKTDIDELTITVTLSVRRDMSSSMRWYLVDGNLGYAPRILYGGNSGSESPWTEWCRNTLWATRGVTDDERKRPVMSCAGSYTVSGSLITLSGNRFEASTGKSFFVNSICKQNGTQSYTPFFFLRFPDANIFAPRELTGFTLPAGDESQTEFAPPIPAWVQNTEKVYKNEQLLTRGVDYTCDNIGNPNDAVEVSPGNFVDRVVSAVSVGGEGVIPGTDQPAYYGLTEGTPMILKYYRDPLVGNSINSIIPGNWTNLVNGSVVKFYVNENIENDTYTEIYSFTATGGTFSDLTRHALSRDFTLARLKITVEHPSSQSDHATRAIYCYSNDYNNPENSICKLLHHTQGIIFATAPAATDVITFAATIDRPWKSPDYIIDFNPSIQF